MGHVHYRLLLNDLTKIHAEINQLNNQRFLVSGASAALLASLATRLLPINSTKALADLVSGSATCLIYSAVLFALTMQSLRLRRFMRIYSSYLVAKHASEWEADWEVFRNGRQHLTYLDRHIHMVVIQLCSLANFASNLFLIYYLWELVDSQTNGTGITMLVYLAPSVALGLVFVFGYLQRRAIREDDNLKSEWVRFLRADPPLPVRPSKAEPAAPVQTKPDPAVVVPGRLRWSLRVRSG